MERNTSKKRPSFRKILCLTISIISVILAGVLTLTSCGETVDGIVIKDQDMPRTTYVMGQELELDKAVITAVVSGSEERIPMTDPEVQITGYNKDQLGEQTVTVTYKEKTTTFKVKVVARMVAEGFKSEYFKGDLFDNTQGKLKITKDDGKTTSVALNSEFVTVSYDFANAGTSTVTAVYSKDGVTYEANFTVTVHEIGTVSFTKPTKSLYASHDEGLDLSGGYFTVKAQGSNLTSYVPLTMDMYKEGFNLELANSDHKTTPLSLTVTLTYAGQDFSFNISVLYSGVSIVKEAAKAISALEITGRDVVIDDALAAIIYEAADEYFKLTQAKKSLIDEDDVNTVMRAAAIVVYRLLNDSAAKFSNTFTLDQKTGNLQISSTGYDQLKTDITSLENKDDPFNVCAKILNYMKDEFEDLYLFSELSEDEKTVEVTVADFVKSPANDELSFYVELFKYMLNVSDLLSTIPADWTLDILEEKKAYIVEAFNYITSSKYVGPNFNGVYNSISSWREKNDYFEIIFTYYLDVSGDVDSFFNAINSSSGLKLHLPGELQIWYTYLSYAASELNVMMSNMNNPEVIMYDTTKFMYYYGKVYESINIIRDSENELYIRIYNMIGGDRMTYSLIEHPSSLGYLYHTYTMLESRAFSEAWAAYMEIATLYLEGKIDLIEHADKFNNVLDKLAALTPSEVYGFISSLNFLYGESVNQKHAFNHNSNTVHSVLAYLMAYYDAKNFGDSRVLMQLLYVMETCASIEAKANGLEIFRTEMANFLAAYGGLSEENKLKFQDIAGDLYTKYLGIYNSYGTTTPDLGESTGKFEELKNTIADFYTIMGIIYSENAENSTRQYYYGLLFALAEKAGVLYTDILENGTDAAKAALYTVEYTFGEDTMTVDNAYFIVRREFLYNVVSYSYNYGTEQNPFQVSLWVTYCEMANLRAFMVDLADILMASYNNEAIAEADLAALFAAFRALESYERNTLYLFGINIYYDTLLTYFTTCEGAVSEDVARAILQCEIGYTDYLKDTTDAGRLEYWASIMSGADTAWSSLSETEKAAVNDLLVEFYEYYLGLFEAANA